MAKHYVSNEGKFFRTRDGVKFTTEEAANAHSAQRRSEISQRIDRELTDREWDLQYIDAAQDSRSMAEKMADEQWSPKLKDELSPDDKHIADLESAGAKRRASEEYRGLNLEERLALDLKKRREREQGEQQAERSEATHLKSVARELELVENLIRSENFNPESDQRFRELLRKTKATLIEPEADPAELARLMAAVDEVRTTRRMNQQAGLQQQREQIEATLAATNQELELLSQPEPAPEHTPDPHGYADPMASPQQNRVDNSSFKKVAINKDQSLQFQLLDLQTAMFGNDYSLEANQAVYDAYDALKTGDDAPAMAVLEQFAE